MYSFNMINKVFSTLHSPGISLTQIYLKRQMFWLWLLSKSLRFTRGYNVASLSITNSHFRFRWFKETFPVNGLKQPLHTGTWVIADVVVADVNIGGIRSCLPKSHQQLSRCADKSIMYLRSEQTAGGMFVCLKRSQMQLGRIKAVRLCQQHTATLSEACKYAHTHKQT